MKKCYQLLIPVFTLVIGLMIGLKIAYATSKMNQVEGTLKVENALKYLAFEPLIIRHLDDECDEGGGNKETIVLRRHKYKSTLIAKYFYTKIDCNDPYNERSEPNIIIKAELNLSREDEVLVVNTIEELLQMKLNAESILSSFHLGIHNSVVLGDSPLVINDYLSGDWPSFNLLKNKILETKREIGTIANPPFLPVSKSYIISV